MMDIVERLRNSTEWAHCKHSMREVAADEIERLRAERQAFADELYELRIRAGCGPEQAGLDVWQQRAELLPALQGLIDRLEYSRGPDYPVVLRQARDAIAKVSK